MSKESTPKGRALIYPSKWSKSIAIYAEYNAIDIGFKGKGYERRTSNVQHRILNKVFYPFKNRQSEAISSFDVQRSTFDVRRSKTAKTFRADRA